MAPTPSIFCLERINAVIDLCIDNELNEELDSFLVLDQPGKLRSILDGRNLPPFNPPQIVWQNLTNILKPYEFILGDVDLRSDSRNALDQWLALFWAKALRAALKRYNRDEPDLYYQLIEFLEKRIPSPQRGDKDKDSVVTTINFLMELSALASGEASYGYANRARSLLKDPFPDYKDPKRGPYDRWIGYNSGIAYQHMIDRNREAVREFNWIIETFIKHVDGNFEAEEHGLEFLLNICPGTLQRSVLNLKMQLGYHALQTLIEAHMDWLGILERSDCRLFRNAAEKLMLKADLYRLEALLQIEELELAEDRINRLYPKVFTEYERTKTKRILPETPDNRNSLQTQLVEHAVTWYLQKMKKNSSAISSSGDDRSKLDRVITDTVSFDEPSVLKAIEIEYWGWANNSWFDKRIYFSRWAQFLGVIAQRLEQFQNLPRERHVELKERQRLLDAGISLYLARHTALPVMQRDRQKSNEKIEEIEIENLRSDDLPDFAKGLAGFYKVMSKLAKPAREFVVPSLKESFIKNNDGRDPVDTLRKDHLQLLDAIDEWEETFAERKRISILNRCNERLIWFCDQSLDGCQNCLEYSPQKPKCRISWYRSNVSHSLENFQRTELDKPQPWAFNGLMPCAGESEHDEPESMQDKDYEYIMHLTEKDLTQHLIAKSQHLPRRKALHFVGLQRWNSETPAQGRSVGGGYFIYRTNEAGVVDLGIAIDPGFDFIRNFFRMGFSLKDIDIVLVSHAHPDHLWDFESMIHLLHELEDKKKIFHRFHAILTLSSYERLEHVIVNPKLKRYVNPLIIDIRKEIDEDFFEKLGVRIDGRERIKDCFRFQKKGTGPDDGQWDLFLPLSSNLRYETGSAESIDISPTRAYHDDHMERSDSFGFLLNFFNARSSANHGQPFCFGYTGDSKWVSDDLYNMGCPANSSCSRKKENKCKWESTAQQYKHCDVLLTHLGSLIDHKKKGIGFEHYSRAQICEELIREKNHPYLMGMIRFLRRLRDISPTKDKLILIGEFGEELRGGIRKDLVDRLYKGVTRSWHVLPVDVGLDICLRDLSVDSDPGDNQPYKFQCILCERYVSVDQIEYLRFGQDEGIFYTCSTCRKATPADVRNAKLQRIYEGGRELRT
jgi:hypothetical protein